MIQAIGAGKNALDFQIACYAGQLAEREPDAFIHFVSKDKGFDIVVKYLESQNRRSSRVESFSSLCFLSGNDKYQKFTLPQKVDLAQARLQKMSATSRPQKRKTLQSSLAAMFLNQLDEPNIKEVIDRLIADNKMAIAANEAVTYMF